MGESYGVLAVLVYDSDPAATTLINMNTDNTSLTSAFISGVDGAAMIDALNAGQEVRITVHQQDQLSGWEEGGQMSSFTSWGSGSGLELKPEITAPGGNIWSTVMDSSYVEGAGKYDDYTGSYSLMSGTSMATPHMAGLAALVEQYVKPLWQPGDLLSSSEKIIGLCQKRVVYKKDMKVGRLARFLSRFASHSSAGIGVDSPYKMQFAINERGALFVLWAAFCAGVAKLFGKRGVFYEMVGQEVSGLDGFYDHEFQEYGEFGIRIPENPGKVCDEIEAATGVQAMIVDANDLNVEILGKASSVTLDDETLKGLIRDNPAGQSRELTPFILIREVKEERAPEEAQA